MHDNYYGDISIIEFYFKIIQFVLNRIYVKRRIAAKMRRLFKGDKYIPNMSLSFLKRTLQIQVRENFEFILWCAVAKL